MKISGNLYTNGYDHYYKDKMLERIIPANKDGSLFPSWGTEGPYTPWVTKLEESLKAEKPMPKPTAFNLESATESEKEFHSTLSDIYNAHSKIIGNEKRRKAEADAQAATLTAMRKADQTVANAAAKAATQTYAPANHSTTNNSAPTVDNIAVRGNMPSPTHESDYNNYRTNITNDKQIKTKNSAIDKVKQTKDHIEKNSFHNNAKTPADKPMKFSSLQGQPTDLSNNKREQNNSATTATTKDKQANYPGPINAQKYYAHNILSKYINTSLTNFENNENSNNFEASKDLVITTKAGKELFRLDGTQRGLSGQMTANELYKEGVQWFEPKADKYLPLISIAPGADKFSEMKHFTWEDIAKFAEESRPMFYYGKHLPGDWKSQKDGGDGYLLVTVDGVPYWADAIGQIPFTVDDFTDYLEESGDYNRAELKTIEDGAKYGDGNVLFPTPDTTNSYDNAMIKRAINWTKKRYDLYEDKYNNNRKSQGKHIIIKNNFPADSLSRTSSGIKLDN